MEKQKKSVYIESTIPSYAAAWDSRDVVVLGKQVQTREWWRNERRKYRLYISPAMMLTWNCTHLGTASYAKLRAYNEKRGLWTPELVTPDTIIGFQEDVNESVRVPVG
jgi:hypothetical protein